MEKISIHAARVGSDLLVIVIRILFMTLISIHAARVGSDMNLIWNEWFRDISIHAARVGSDLEFLHDESNYEISIHAARVGSDLHACRGQHFKKNFNPRCPSGQRLRTM